MNLILKEITFYLLCVIHAFVWLFVVFAFLNKKTAKINLYLIIPIIYLLHILPFHILTSSKEIIIKDKNKREKKISKIEHSLIFPKIYYYFHSFCEKNSTFSPLTPQGMMVFGLISCVYRLYPISFNRILN